MDNIPIPLDQTFVFSKAPAVRSISSLSSTFESHIDAFVPYLTADPLPHGDHATRRHLRRLTGIIGLLKPSWRAFHTEPFQCFSRQSAKPFYRHWSPIKRGCRGASVDALTNFYKIAFPDKLSKSTPHLIVAAKVAEIGTQKHITALAINPFHQACFQCIRSHNAPLHCQFTTG